MESNNQKPSIKDGGVAGAVVVFFILLFVFAKWGPSIPFSVISTTQGIPMMVTGEGKVNTVPDVAKINAGIEVRATSIKSAQESANQKSQTLVSSLKEMGVKDEDIKTTNYNIYPETDYSSSPLRITGYSVSINYAVTVNNIDKVNDVLLAVTQNGANVVGGVNFELSESAKNKALDSARKQAVEDAKNSAESLANASGVTLGKIININESQSPNIRPLYNTQEAKVATDMGAPAPQIEPGTTEVSLNVTLSYQVR